MPSYTGACHCKAVRFEAEAELSPVIRCNCSHCAIKGLRLVFTPRAHFKLLAGADKLSTYLFNKQVIQHQFCSLCGVEPFGLGVGPDGAEMAALNIRCLDDVDWESLETMACNGKDF